jgi:hypothetical protein
MYVSIRRRTEVALTLVAVAAAVSLWMPGAALGASVGPGLVGLESPAPSGSTASPAPSTEPAHGSATPEDAVTAYIHGVAANDFGQVLSACAVDEMAAGYRFDLAATRLNAFIFSTMWAPASYSFYEQINVALEQGQLARAVMFLSYSLLASEPLDPGSIVTPVDEARAQQFVSEVDPAQLAGLSVVDIAFPKASLEQSPKLLANYDASAKTYSADEQTERVALVSLDGRDYVVGFTLLRYGTQWFVAYPTSPLYGLSPTGIAEPTTQADFEDKTAS